MKEQQHQSHHGAHEDDVHAYLLSRLDGLGIGGSVVIAYFASRLSVAGVPRSPILVEELVGVFGELLAAI
jgi:hypothetical protein